MQDIALLGPVLLLALGMRLINLGSYSGLFDEGIRAEQLFLMSQGYRPFKDIFAAQGPLLLDSMYLPYALFGAFVDPPLVAVRLVAVSYSLVGLAGLYWVGRQLAGPLGGLAAALALALSPLYLEGSRLALAEVPAMAPAILAIGCALRYQNGGRVRWLVAAGLLLTLSLLMKPIAFAAAPAVALAALLRGPRGFRHLTLVTAAMLLIVALVIWLLGFAQVQDQILGYREASREAAGWSLRKNLRVLQAGLGYEPGALLPLAGIGGAVLLMGGWQRSAPVLLWALGGLGLLLVYSPLHGKHLVVLVPGAALLAGAGCARAWQLLARLIPANRSLLAAAPLTLAGLWYGVSLAPLLPQTGQLLRVTADTDVDPAFDQYGDAVSALKGLTTADDFIVTDQPYLAFLAGRKVPPELVDTALARIRSRSLTGSKAQALAEEYNPKVVLLWGDRLRSLAGFKSWVESNYQVVKIYNRRDDTDRALYLRRDADFNAARTLLRQPILDGTEVDFAGELRLAGSTLQPTDVAVGQVATLTMLWEQLAPTGVDYHVLVELRRPDGSTADDQEESLGGGSEGTSRWPAGRWLVQSTFVLTQKATPGEYVVTIALYDSKARRRIPLPGALTSEVVVGQLVVHDRP